MPLQRRMALAPIPSMEFVHQDNYPYRNRSFYDRNYLLKKRATNGYCIGSASPIPRATRALRGETSAHTLSDIELCEQRGRTFYAVAGSLESRLRDKYTDPRKLVSGARAPVGGAYSSGGVVEGGGHHRRGLRGLDIGRRPRGGRLLQRQGAGPGASHAGWRHAEVYLLHVP